MRTGPSKIAEAIVSALIPPACREEILGDLHERFQSPLQYLVDVMRTVPLVIFSRARRTTDTWRLLLQAVVLYAAFLGYALLYDAYLPLFREPRGYLRLAIPAAAALIGQVLGDAYGKLLAFLLGMALPLASEEILRIGSPAMAIPLSTTVSACIISLGIPPVRERLRKG